MRTQTTIKITVRHRLAKFSGTKIANVYDDDDGTMFVTIDGFGCSRNYVTKSNREAVEMFLAEHCATLVEIQ